MFRKLLKPLAATAFAASLVFPQAAFAASTADALPAAQTRPQVSDVATSTAPAADDWIAINPGEYRWYMFKYHYDSANRPAVIRLDAQPQEGVDLMLLNGDQARNWQSGVEREHFGAATTVYNRVVDKSVHHAVHKVSTRNYDYNKEDAPTTMERGNYAVWSGVIGNSGTYYVLVHRDSHANGPAYYHFTFNGDGVSALQSAN